MKLFWPAGQLSLEETPTVEWKRAVTLGWWLSSSEASPRETMEKLFFPPVGISLHSHMAQWLCSFCRAIQSFLTGSQGVWSQPECYVGSVRVWQQSDAQCQHYRVKRQHSCSYSDIYGRLHCFTLTLGNTIIIGWWWWQWLEEVQTTGCGL